jgi:hypothetical protein
LRFARPPSSLGVRLPSVMALIIHTEHLTPEPGLRAPEKEATVWLEKIVAADRQRTKYQEMTAEELITFEELRERLGELEETRKTAQSELESISLHQKRLEELERDADDLVRHYAALVPESLEVIPSEEKHRIYKTLRMKVLVNIEGTVTVEIVSGKVPEPDTGSVNSGDLCSLIRTRTSRGWRFRQRRR